MDDTAAVSIDFASEVKTDRLQMLWKATLAFAAGVLIISGTFVFMRGGFEPLWLLTPLAAIIGCSATAYALRHRGVELASWVYSLAMLFALSLGMYSMNAAYYTYVPFTFILVIAIAGLMLRPVHTFMLAFIAIGLMLTVPAVAHRNFEFVSTAHFVAGLLTLMSAAVAAQVAGELYAITEWALMNYKRERRTNGELFENRLALEKTLKRSEALSESLKELNTELEAARMSAEAAKHFRGQFLANMSHELRTPLNAIIGFSETMRKFPMMYDDVPLPEAYEHDLDQIFSSGKHLLNLINDILDLAKIDAGKLDVRPTIVELEPIINGVMATAGGLIAAKPIKLVRDFNEPLPQVFADPNRLRQILLNLYSNAVKFTDEGTITLTVRDQDANNVHFVLTDSGCGISPENHQIIFEEFKQASNNAGRDPRSGSGLGLAISKQLVTLMNGRIWVESQVGKGSAFHVTLPKPPIEKVNEKPENHVQEPVA